MEIKDLRNEINIIDDQIIDLLLKRFDVVKDVAEYKFANNLPILNKEREQEILSKLKDKLPPDKYKYVAELYENVFTISKQYQVDLIENHKKLPNSGGNNER